MFNLFSRLFDGMDLILNPPKEPHKIFKREKIPKGHRTGKKGEVIFCPSCYAPTGVYNFSWSTLTCHVCANNINKYEWFLDKGGR